MSGRLLLLLLLICLSVTGCQTRKSIDYTINENDRELLPSYDGLWTQEEYQWIEENRDRHFVFATAKDYIPLEYLNETGPQGVGVNILILVSKATGLKFKLYDNNSNEDWHELISNFKKDKIDILPTVSYSNERTSFLDFTNPYIETSLAIIGHKDNYYPLTLGRIENSVAIPKEYWLNDYLRKKRKDIEIYPVKDTQEAFDAVNKKLAAYTIAELPLFTYYRESAANKNLRIVGQIEEKNPIMLGVQKDLPILTSIINKVIDNMDKNQFIQASIVMPQKTNDHKTLIMVLLLIILIISVLLIRSLLKIISTKKQLELSIQQKTKFMEDISHDLKTPIMSTIGYIDTVIDEEIQNDVIKQDYLKRVQSITLYMRHLVNDLFTLSKLENHIELKKEKTLINSLVNDAVSIIRIKADKKNISLILNLEATNQIQIKIDPLRINQVLCNILYNAVKYTPQNGRIIISTKPLSNGKIKISIKDSGKGIPPNDLPYVFDRYYKSENNMDPHSSGLGLCIAKQLILQHEGKIWVESKLDQGSTFMIEI